jgi:hypothetical protein
VRAYAAVEISAQKPLCTTDFAALTSNVKYKIAAQAFISLYGTAGAISLIGPITLLGLLWWLEEIAG